MKNNTLTKQDEYADLRAAQKSGEVIEYYDKQTGWRKCTVYPGNSVNWVYPVENYRIAIPDSVDELN